MQERRYNTFFSKFSNKIYVVGTQKNHLNDYGSFNHSKQMLRQMDKKNSQLDAKNGKSGPKSSLYNMPQSNELIWALMRQNLSFGFLTK